MAGASPLQQKIAGMLGLGVLVLACLYRWGDEIGYQRGQVASQAPAVAATTAAREVPETASNPSAATEIVATTPELTVEPVRPDAIDVAEAGVRETANAALGRAVEARAAGRLLSPESDNALAWVDRALVAVPTSVRARNARESMLEVLLADAASALDRGDADPATVLLERVPAVDEAAGEELEALAERLALNRQVQRKIVEAGIRFEEGRIYATPGDSALDSYRAALALDPRNRVARAGVADIAARILDGALSAVAQDKVADADRLLDLVASIDPGDTALLDARTHVREVKERRAQTLVARVRAALSARQLDLAAELVARLRTVGFDLPRATVDDLEDRIEVLQQYAGHAPGDVFHDGFRDRSARGPDLVSLPLGEFEMGSIPAEAGRRRNEGPLRKVRVARPFALSLREVTQGEFAEFVAATRYRTDAERIGHSFVWDESSGRLLRRNGVDWRLGFSGRRALPSAPVMHVSWRDADAYVKWLAVSTGESYRLPSEAEFEFALRAGDDTRFPWGPQSPSEVRENVAGSKDRSNGGRGWSEGFEDYSDAYFGPSPAGALLANAFGLFDMGGNLSEWVADCWHDSYRRAPADASAWINPGCTQHVVRGGSWGSGPAEARSAHRSSQLATARSARLGFRVARDL